MVKIIAVVSGKGGVGKTTISTALGAALSRHGSRVLLLDEDLGLCNMDLLLGVENRVKYNINDFATGRCFPEEVILHVTENLDFIAGTPDVTWDNILEESMETVLEDFSPRYDYVILDCPAGMGKGIDFACRVSDVAVAVLAPTRASRRDVKRILSSFEGKLPVKIVMNEFRMSDDSRISINDMYREINPDMLLGVIPYSVYAAKLSNEGKLISYDSKEPFGMAIDIIAKNIIHPRFYPLSRWLRILSLSQKEEEETLVSHKKEEENKKMNLLSRMAYKWGRRRR